MNVLIHAPDPRGGVSTWLDACNAALSRSSYKLRLKKSIYSLLRDSSSGICILWGPTLFLSPFIKKCICLTHGTPSMADQGLFKAVSIWVSILVVKLSKKPIYVVSCYSSSLILSVLGLDAIVLRNTLSDSRYELYTAQASTSRDTDFLYAGRVTSTKFPDYLKDFLLKLDHKYRCIIVSSASDLKAVGSMSSSRVETTSWASSIEMVSIYQQSRVLISCSPSEPFGYVFLEALYAGCCIVAPRSGGGLEIASFGFIDRFFFYDVSDHSSFLTACKRAHAHSFHTGSEKAFNERINVLHNRLNSCFSNAIVRQLNCLHGESHV